MTQTLKEVLERTDWQRYQAFVVTDGDGPDPTEDWPGNPVSTINRERQDDYDIEGVRRISAEVLEFDSLLARQLWSGHRNVHIRVERLHVRTPAPRPVTQPDLELFRAKHPRYPLSVYGNFVLVLTCPSIPEQYDAYLPAAQQRAYPVSAYLDAEDAAAPPGWVKVAYLRLRGGRFTCNVPSARGEQVYRASPDGESEFESWERRRYLTEALAAVTAYLAQQEARRNDPANNNQVG
jgi:hypothetical protein